MFFKEFSEKDKKEVEIGEVEPDVFQLFIDVVNGINSITDEYSEVALVAAIYLGSSTLEEKILKHLAEDSEISLKEQFKIAEDQKSYKLMIQVCASIKDAYELDEVVPKDLDSFCNRTKNLVLQRSFELLGIRRPPSPPLPEERDQLFEHMMNQIIDQVEVQNHHGQILVDQFELLLEHLCLEENMLGLSDAVAQTTFNSLLAMSTEPSRKRGGDKSSEDPPSKVPIVDPSVAPHDVVLIVKGQKFYCMKEKLAENSTFFEKMFFAEFSEKDKKEIEIGEVEPDVFQLFIDVVNIIIDRARSFQIFRDHLLQRNII
ncbi:unnamed protein product [Caenorhabditis brenneri]